MDNRKPQQFVTITVSGELPGFQHGRNVSCFETWVLMRKYMA